MQQLEKLMLVKNTLAKKCKSWQAYHLLNISASSAAREVL